jgi:hypothetical protein
MRPVDEEGKDLASIELSRFANADLELARRPLGDSDVPIIFRKDNGVRVYKLEMRQMGRMGGSTIDAKVFQRKGQTTTIKDDGEAAEGSLLELSPDASIC